MADLEVGVPIKKKIYHMTAPFVRDITPCISGLQILVMLCIEGCINVTYI